MRIPVFWGNMMANDGMYTINSDYIARVKEIMDYCCNVGLYTVINIHHFNEFIIRRNSDEKCAEIFTRIWTQIAEYFKDYPYTVMFERYNEYLGGNRFDENGQLSSDEAVPWKWHRFSSSGNIRKNRFGQHKISQRLFPE